jgi:hypothetical protein
MIDNNGTFQSTPETGLFAVRLGGRGIDALLGLVQADLNGLGRRRMR